MGAEVLGGDDDAFAAPEEISAADADRWAVALDLRASSPHQRRLRAMAMESGGVRAGQTVAEIGCGTGTLLSELAAAVGESGRVIGIEPVPAFARRARDRATSDGFGERVTVHTARAQAIELADLDACFSQTTMIHVPPSEQESVMADALRWLRAGGAFITVDQDADTWTIDHSDRELTRRIIQYNCDRRYGDGWFGRRARSMMRVVGLTAVVVRASTHVETDPTGYLFGMAQRVADAAASRGAITDAEREAWLVELQDRADRALFFSSITYFVVAGRKGTGLRG